MDTKKYCEDEYLDSLIYKIFAEKEKDPKNRQILLQLSDQEKAHYEFWRKFLPDNYQVKNPSRFKLAWISLMRVIFGLTFTIKFLELHEEKVIKEYEKDLQELEGEDKKKLEVILAEEKEHERFFMGQLQENRIKYLGFIVLGLADAIVEITGVHAGFLGVTGRTVVAGVAGIIVGVSAAISMASAAFLQAKQDKERSPLISAGLTGVSYILAVLILAVPYFLTSNMVLAFIVSVWLGILLIFFFSFYGAIVFERNFLKEFLVSAGLMLGTAFATYLIGEYLGHMFNLR
ncbi:hypothetical protein HRbin34_00293 [bacterium HR34]|nr:hypothetical protein HRbin34_00293 [bacterium HR34]